MTASDVHTLPPPGEFATAQEVRAARRSAELAARRKRLLLWSAPVVAIAVLAALKLLSAVVINLVGINAYSEANHGTAAARFSQLEVVNVVEPWKAHFNQGTAIYASGEFFASTSHFQTALDLVPADEEADQPGEEECMVRTNYSLAYEGLGDEALATGDAAMASSYYDQAQEMLSTCGEDGGNGGEQAQEAEERQQQSQSDAEEEQQQDDGEGGGEDPSSGEDDPSSGDPSESGSDNGSQDPSESGSGGGESESPSESRDPQQEELESANREANEEASASEQAGGNGGENGSGAPDGRNW